MSGIQLELPLIAAVVLGFILALTPLTLADTFSRLVVAFRRQLPANTKHDPKTPHPRGARPIVHVSNGEVAPDSTPSARNTGGPALLLVDLSSAAVLDVFGQITRTVGPGVHLLGTYERVAGALDTRVQFRTSNSRVLTRDGVPVTYAVEIEFRLLQGAPPPVPSAPAPPPELPRQSRMQKLVASLRRRHATVEARVMVDYHFSAAAARMAVYPMNVGEDGAQEHWGNVVERRGIGEIDDVLSAHEFDDLCLPGEGAPEVPRAQRSLRRRIQAEAYTAAERGLQAVGARLLGLRFTSFTFDQAEASGVIDQYFADWHAYWMAQRRLALAEGEQRALAVAGDERAKAQALKLSALATGIVTALQAPVELDKVALMRTLEAIEHMSLDQQAAHNLPLEVRDLIEQMGLLTGTTTAAPPTPGSKERKT